MSPLTLWVIYDHPRDYPREFVARKWVGEEPSGEILCSYSVRPLQEALRRRGLRRIERHSRDDPVIVESWL